MTYTPPTEYQRAFRAIEAQLANLKRNVNETHAAFLIIGVCIDQGLNTRGHICNLAKGFGKNPQQVAAILIEATGNDPELFPWYVDSEGHYWKHPT